MELRKHLNWRGIFVGLYVLAFGIYIAIGLQPAEASDYVISGTLSIPKLSLTSEVTDLTLENGQLNTPDTIVGSYTRAPHKTLLIGHSTTVFRELDKVEPGDDIYYNDKIYRVIKREVLAKPDISMGKLLRREEEDTLVIMTCAGELKENGDATHRLIITASIL